MNRVARKGLVTAMVAGGLLAAAGHAEADSAARGGSAGSPGVLSGNGVQVPVDVPVNVCGDTISVVGLLNSASGNACTNTSDHAGVATATGARPARHARTMPDTPPGHLLRALNGFSGSGAHAVGSTDGSPGVLAGNGLRLPVDLPVNLSGNTVDVVGIGNASSGNTSVNGGTPTPPPPAHTPVPAPPNDTVAAPHPGPTLAHTGADGLPYTAGVSAGLLLGGVLLYRRFRPGRG